MKIKFPNRMEAIEWIAHFAKNEGQFEVLREQLNFNRIYYGYLFLDLKKLRTEVVFLDSNRRN